MTAARAADRPATLAVEFDCDRRCQVEFDMADVHIRFTLGQMLVAVDRAHEEAHAVDPVSVFRYRGAFLVRAGVAGDGR